MLTCRTIKDRAIAPILYNTYLHLGLTMLVNEVRQGGNGLRLRFTSRPWALEYDAANEGLWGAGGSHWKILGATRTGGVSVTIPDGCSLHQARRLVECALTSGNRVVSLPPVAEVPGRLLSQREITVLRYLRRGIPQTQCAEKLGLSVKTVNGYKQRAMKTLGFKNNRQLQFWLLGSACLATLAED